MPNRSPSTSSPKSDETPAPQRSPGQSPAAYPEVMGKLKVCSESKKTYLTTGPLPPGIRSIIRVEREMLRDALQYLWLEGTQPNPDYAQRFMKFATDTKLELDQCFACVRADGRLFPVALAVPNPGRTAMIFASHLTERRRQAELTALYQFLAANLDRERIGLVQILLTKPERRALACFEAAGFFKLAELLYLERKLPRHPPGSAGDALLPESDWPTGVTLETFTNAQEAAFKQAIADSYVETLDCPGLCELRTIEDVFLGHQSTGRFDPALWILVRKDTVPAAVLLLSAFDEQDHLELTYLGVGAAARGLGLGRRLVAEGLRMAQRAGKSRLTLAVDQQNQPALKLYRKAGFRQTDQRLAVVLPVAE